MTAFRTFSLLSAASMLFLACAVMEPKQTFVVTPPPIASLDGSAYETGARVKLPRVDPREEKGLHNVYMLGDNIISGSEPHGAEAFAKLAEMGVKTILSVDGKTPDAELAASYGMTYVHVPIQYSGIEQDELVKISKTFREKESPVYVHCFHGKHRGPAAAEIGRLALDGIPRDQALAEMRQWCGTSPSYEGLYRAVAETEIPTHEETAAYDFDFPNEHPFRGFRRGMIDVTRADDEVKYLAKNDWQPGPEHPDLDPVNAAAKLAGALERCATSPQALAEPADFQAWMEDSVAAANELRVLLEGMARNEESSEAPTAAYKRVAANCIACHEAYRN